ncbi:MAG: type II CAAX endopeptidase family protein [Chloroflexota bacterium]
MSDLLAKPQHPLIAWGKIGRVRWFQQAKWLYEPVAIILVTFFSLLFGQILSLPIQLSLAGSLSDEIAALGTETSAINELFMGSLFADPQLLAGLTILSFLGMHIVVWLWIWLMENRSWWTIGLPFRAIGGWQVALFQYGRGLLIGFGLQMATVGILALLGMISFETPFSGFSGLVLFNVVLLFVSFIIQGAAEEVLTRGFIFQVVGRKYGVWLAVIVSSLIFALLHLGNPNIGPIAVINLFLAGLLFALYALNEGTIWGACAVHSIWNWTMGNLLGLEVSGMEFAADTGSLIDLQETGPDLITGGAFGPEGGLVVLTLLVLTCGYLIYNYVRHPILTIK